MVGLQVTGAPLRTDVSPHGIISFEFAGELDLAQRMVESWGSTGRIYAGLNLGLDYLFLAVNPHIDWPAEQTVGARISVDHTSATPPGFEICARVRLVQVDGRRLVFDIELNDGVDIISKGTHERFIIDAEKFNLKMKQKADTINHT
jgi:urease beta subunit